MSLLAFAAATALLPISGLYTIRPKSMAEGPRQTAATTPYHWKSVQIVGGGFVDGIIFHPTAKDVRYARTDIGGAYRWDPRSRTWQPILDWLSLENTNLMGVESIALDPTDPKRVYLACGMYSNSSSPNAAFLRSDDYGKTFQRADVPFKMGGNENGRGNGERLTVDPANPKTLYFGSRHDGLWKSTDGAATWNPVTTFPSEPDRGAGIVSVLVDPKTHTVYAAVSYLGKSNLFRSPDGGTTWESIPGEPTAYRPTRMVLAKDETLYITYGASPGPSRMPDGAVWRLDTGRGTWTDITPEKPDATHRFGYPAVSVQSDDPNVVVVSTFDHPKGEEIFRSRDRGATWKPVFHSGGATYDFKKAPYVAKTPIHWLFDLAIDPCNPNHAMFTTGYGGYETFNLTDLDAGKPTHWEVMSKGIEETVALSLLSPSAGVHLMSGIGDYGSYVHWNLDKPSPEGNSSHPTLGNCSGVAGAALNPMIAIRCGTQAGSYGGGNFGSTLDGGKNWRVPPTTPVMGSRDGSVALNADGSTWFWTPGRSVPYFTRDEGKTWIACVGLPMNARIVANPLDSKKLYAMDLFGGTLFTSTDGGATFTPSPLQFPDGPPKRGGDRGDNRGGQDRLYTTPGKDGDLWIAAFDGLYHTPNPTQPFKRIEGVDHIWGLGFGKPAPGSAYPTLFTVGNVNGVRGVFRSTDQKTWTRINDDPHQWGLILQVTGDPRVFGRVYVGTHGRGILYGDPK